MRLTSSRTPLQDFEPPSGKLLEKIDADFGSLDHLISKFNAAAAGVQVCAPALSRARACARGELACDALPPLLSPPRKGLWVGVAGVQQGAAQAGGGCHAQPGPAAGDHGAGAAVGRGERAGGRAEVHVQRVAALGFVAAPDSR